MCYLLIIFSPNWLENWKNFSFLFKILTFYMPPSTTFYKILKNSMCMTNDNVSCHPIIFYDLFGQFKNLAVILPFRKKNLCNKNVFQKWSFERNLSGFSCGWHLLFAIVRPNDISMWCLFNWNLIFFLKCVRNSTRINIVFVSIRYIMC